MKRMKSVGGWLAIGRRFSDPGILPDSAPESPVLGAAKGRKARF